MQCIQLRSHQLPEPRIGKVQQAVQLLTAEWRSFRGALKFQQIACVVHHHIQVHIGPTVFAVVEIEQGMSLDQSYRDCCYLVDHGIGADAALSK